MLLSLVLLKLNLTTIFSSSENEIEGYDLLRLDQSRRRCGVACYVKRPLAYNYKDNFS